MIALKNGPANKSAECSDCGLYFKEDIYIWRGKVLCGDCRYFARTGKRPPRRPNRAIASPVREHEFGGVINSQEHFAVLSQKHATFLGEWLAECALSLCALLLLVTGCSTFTRGPELERARAAVAVAIAEVSTGVTAWQGDLPLIGAEVDTDEPANSGIPDEQISGSAESDIPDSIDWQLFGFDTVQLSRESGKPLWLHVVHDGCGPCARLSETVFVDQEFVSQVDERFVAVQVDRFKGAGPAVVNVFQAGGVDPVDIFVLPSGKYLRYVGAPPSTTAFLNRLKGAEQHAGQAKWPGYVTAASAGKWKLNGETIDVAHLVKHTEHRGKFPAEWLGSLSRNQLLTLHDHDHDHVVRWEFVPPAQ